MPDNNGNIPKRSDERLGHGGSPISEITHAEAYGFEKWPMEDREWHIIAKRWYRALDKSGQKVFYEESDIATAYYVAEVMSRSLKDKKMSSMLVQTVLSASNELLTTEGARRRLRVELGKPDVDNDENVSAANAEDYVARLAQGL